MVFPRGVFLATSALPIEEVRPANRRDRRSARGAFAAGLALGLLAVAGCIPPTVEELPRGPLSVEDVVMMSRAGVGDRAIIAKIQLSRIEPRLDPTAIVGLRSRGVSDPVIEALIRASEAPPPTQLEVVRRYEAAPWLNVWEGPEFGWPYGKERYW
jgi:hypothetical protein